MKVIQCKNCYATLNPEQKYFSGGNTLKCEFCGTVHLIESDSPLTRDYSTISLKKDYKFIVFVRDLLISKFETAALKRICLTIVSETGKTAFDYEEIAGETKSIKCQELAMKACRYGAMNALIKAAGAENRNFALAVEGYVL